jgi:hypothetical protein
VFATSTNAGDSEPPDAFVAAALTDVVAVGRIGDDEPYFVAALPTERTGGRTFESLLEIAERFALSRNRGASHSRAPSAELSVDDRHDGILPAPGEIIKSPMLTSIYW